MKKLYFALLAAIFAIVANAETVKFTNPDNWAKVYAYVYNGDGELLGTWPGTEMTQDGDLWTVDVNGNPAKIIFNNNDGSQTGNLDFVAGATYDKNGAIGAELNDYKVYFDNKAGWNKVYIYTWGPAMAGGWPGTELQKNSDGLYEWVYQATSTPSFDGIKFSDGNGQETDDLTYEVGKTYTNGNGDDPEPPTPGEYPVLYLVGTDFGDWSFVDEYKMTETDGIYTITLAEMPASGFKFSTDGWKEQWSTKNTAMELDTEYTCVDGDGMGTDMALAAAATNVTITFNYDTKALIITGNGDVPPTPVDQDVYLVGTFNDWTPADEAYKMEQNGNVYTYTFTDKTFTNEDELKFVGDKNWAWNFAAGEISSITLDTDMETWFNSYTNFNFAGIELKEDEVISNLKVTFTLVEGSAAQDSPICSTARFSYEIRTGVESIIADSDVNVEYYNLQGVRVANPVSGLYIRVAGDKATKVRL